MGGHGLCHGARGVHFPWRATVWPMTARPAFCGWGGARPCRYLGYVGRLLA